MKTLIWDKLSPAEQATALQRPVAAQNQALVEKTQAIIAQVQSGGDDALKALTQQLDHVTLDDLRVTTREWQQATQIKPAAKSAIDTAYQNIHTFHAAQKPQTLSIETTPGVRCEKHPRAIQSVGLYIPGGSAPLISTALMLGVPAQIADNPERVICTPPGQSGDIDPHILYAAQRCGIDTVYKIGGAQAIAAMAYGTQTVTKVNKIYGPGNAWVTQAKQQVAQDPQGASIDMPAGPSEVMVIADNAANARFVAIDLLSQAEHGADSQAVLVCLSSDFAAQVTQAVQSLLAQLPRKAIAEQALAHSTIIVAKTLAQAVVIANTYAPEHLIIQTAQPQALLADITCAGSVFLGAYTPESVGDYASGTNHVLPTFGYARNHSGLSVGDFMLQITAQSLTKSGLAAIGDAVQTLATLEGLQAHQLAVALRLEDDHDRETAATG